MMLLFFKVFYTHKFISIRCYCLSMSCFFFSPGFHRKFLLLYYSTNVCSSLFHIFEMIHLVTRFYWIVYPKETILCIIGIQTNRKTRIFPILCFKVKTIIRFFPFGKDCVSLRSIAAFLCCKRLNYLDRNVSFVCISAHFIAIQILFEANV